MSGVNRGDSPLETVAQTAAPATTDAFELLSNETRLAILLALWEAFEPFDTGKSVPFTTLRKRVGVRDGSQFNYHLDKLVGHFVRKTDDGYELTGAGLAIVWAVIGGTGIEEPQFEPAVLDELCPLCDAPTMLMYEDAHLVLVCTECEGNGPFRDELSDGVLFFTTFGPTGLSHRSPEAVLDVCHVQADHADGLLREGVCPSCTGPVESELLICEDHDPPSGALCSSCHRRAEVITKHTCLICKNGALRPPKKTIVWHPAVVAFSYDHVIDGHSYASDPASIFELQKEIRVREHEIVSSDPPRLLVTVECGGDELYLTLDETANVVEVNA